MLYVLHILFVLKIPLHIPYNLHFNSFYVPNFVTTVISLCALTLLVGLCGP